LSTSNHATKKQKMSLNSDSAATAATAATATAATAAATTAAAAAATATSTTSATPSNAQRRQRTRGDQPSLWDAHPGKNLVTLVNHIFQNASGDFISRTKEVIGFFFRCMCSVSFPRGNAGMRLGDERARLNYILLRLTNDQDDNTTTRLSDLKYRLGSLCPSDEDIVNFKEADVKESLLRVEADIMSMFLVKYNDGNRHFLHPWHIESRSAGLSFDRQSGSWVVVLPAMPKGPETVGDKDHDITDTQDVTIGGSMTHFAPHYQNIVGAINGDDSLISHIKGVKVTSKRDGMCIRFVYVRKGTFAHQFWMTLINECKDQFVQAFIQEAITVMDGNFLIPASNGTAFMTFEPVQAWTVCAMALSFGITNAALEDANRKGAKPVDILNMATVNDSTVLRSFVTGMAQTVIRDGPEVQTHCFEAIGGPNRKAALNTALRWELATNYAESECGMTYLGFASSTSEGSTVWISHDMVSTPFVEPSYWMFDTLQQVRHFLNDLSSVVLGKVTMEELTNKYPRKNKNLQRCTLPDPEGVVLYVLLQAFGNMTWIYCKGKTWIFYVCHKPEKYFNQIARLPDCVSVYFSARRVIRDFCQSIDQIVAMLTKLHQFVKSPSVRQHLVNMSGRSKGSGKVSKAPGDGLDQRPVDVQYKIIINNTESVLYPEFVKIASQYFNCFAGTSDREQIDEVGATFKNCLMNLKCYDDSGHSAAAACSEDADSQPAWEKELRRQFNIDNIGDLPPVPKILWPIFINSNGDTPESE
jgi:hypothetical protein